MVTDYKESGMTKKTRRRVIWCSVIAVVVLAGGAAAAAALHMYGKSVQSDEIVFANIGEPCMGKSGFYYQKQNQNDSRYYYFDYSSKESVVLCNRPNCTHEDETICDAYFDGIPLLAQYNDKLYFLVPGYENSVIYVANSDGSNKKRLISINGNLGFRLAIADNKLFYEKNVQQYDENLNPVGNPKVSICMYDLTVHKNSTLTKVRSGIDATIKLLGYYNNAVYYMYQDNKKKADPNIDYNEANLSYFKSLIGHQSIYRYDISTGKETEILNSLDKFGISPTLYQDSIFYMTTDKSSHVTTLYRYRLDNNKLQVIASGKDLYNGIIECADGKVFYSRGVFNGKSVTYTSIKTSYAYDLKTGKSTEVKLRSGNNCYSVIGASSDLVFFLVGKNEALTGSTSDLSYAYMNKKDFYKGKLKCTIIK